MRFEEYSTEKESLAAFDEALRLLYQMNADHLKLLNQFIARKLIEWQRELAGD